MHDLNHAQIWVLGIIENTTKQFRIVATKNRNSDNLSKFITTFVPKGNYIISDGWQGYQWLDNILSGYRHIKHIHNHGIFGFGLESSSHIESIWNSLKLKIKSIYKTIPQKNFLFF